MGVQLHQTGGHVDSADDTAWPITCAGTAPFFLEKELITTTAIVSRIKRCTSCVFPAC